MKRVAVVYHYFALYRLGILKELSSCELYDFVFYGDKNNEDGIELISMSQFEENNISWHKVSNYYFFKKRLLWQKGLFRICLSSEFDSFIFLGNPHFISTWFCSIVLKFRKIPFYFWTHGVSSREYGLKGLIRRCFLNLPNKLLLYGNHAKEILFKMGFNSDKLFVVNNSLDYNYQKRIRNSISISDISYCRINFFSDPTLPQLIFVGRLINRKKINLLLDAILLLRKDNIFLNLLIVGEGPERKKLENFVSMNSLEENVFFYGASYKEDELGLLISSSDLCVSPGEIGLLVMHSLAYGVPVITHDNFSNQGPEFEAIIPDVTGSFFIENSVYDLINKILFWINQYTDKSIISEKCINVLEESFTPDVQKKLILKAIKL